MQESNVEPQCVAVTRDTAIMNNGSLVNGSAARMSVTTATPSTAVREQKYPEIKQTGYYSDIVGPGARDEIGVRLLFATHLLISSGLLHLSLKGISTIFNVN